YWRGRHLGYFAQLAAQAETALRGPEQIVWLNRLEDNLDNLRAALDFSQASRPSAETEAGLRLAAALRRFWTIRGHWREAYNWLEAALAHGSAPANSLARAEALYTAAALLVDAAVGTRRWSETEIWRARAEAAESVAILRAAGAPGRRGLAF